MQWAQQATAAAVLVHASRSLGDDAMLMPIKGTLLGRTHYDDPADRTLSDCDVLIARPSLAEAIRRLLDRGFTIVPGSRSLDVVTLATPAARAMTLDLHSRPLPAGIGRVTTSWMFENARPDTALFGVPLSIPDERRLLVQVVGNILKDHVFRPFPHTYEDVRRIATRRVHSPTSFADAFADARLRIGGWIVLTRVLETGWNADVAQLRDALRLSNAERAWATWRSAHLRANAASEAPGVVARVVARFASDSLRDGFVGLGHAVAGTAAEWWSRTAVSRAVARRS
jgi:hypothetical protein